jgi:anionic cell wall polymer biosynthesis LytR-Cps2A-Psr (LCP) family protein
MTKFALYGYSSCELRARNLFSRQDFDRISTQSDFFAPLLRQALPMLKTFAYDVKNTVKKMTRRKP